MGGVNNIVQKLWGLCDILRDDGITYYQYVNELTYLLFLKIAEETKTEKQLPTGYRWSDLVAETNIKKKSRQIKIVILHLSKEINTHLS